MVIDTIIYSLITNKTFFDRTHDKLFKYNKKIFENKSDQYILRMLEKYFNDKSIVLNFDDLLLKVENNKKLEESVYQELVERINYLKNYQYNISVENLKEETKKFIQDTLVEKFMYKCAEFLGDEKNNTSHDELLKDMEEIANINFDSNIGYFANTKELFNDYFINKVSFNFNPLDELSFGGLPKKTLNMIYGAAHAGKTQLMIHIACCMAMSGLKVLYVTSELTIQMLKQRIDSWFFEMPSWKINPRYMKQEQYDEMISVAEQYMGNINLKEYPTEGAHAMNVKEYYDTLIKDQNWEADIIIVDSINQMGSIRNIGGDKPHIKLKYVFTEFRALAFLLNKPILSPTHLSDEGEKAVEMGEDVKTNHMGEFKMLKAIADFILGFKQMYVDKNGVIYKDSLLEKSITEEYELIENKDFSKIVKLNILKSRYGSKVGDYKYLGSNIDYSKFYDFKDWWDNRKNNSNNVSTNNNINNKKEEITTKENNNDNESTSFVGRKKRTKF